MKIAVYSGSFNPMHIGHIAVVRYLLDHGGFDMVYLIVSPQNPFKDGSIRDNARERYLGAAEAIRRQGLENRVKVDDIEFGRPAPSYTINTLDALKEREPRNRFTLVIGGDNIGAMLKWKEGERLLCDYGIVVYPREGYNMVREARILKQQHRNAEILFGDAQGHPWGSAEFKHRPYRIKLLKDAPLVTISSTQIREMIRQGLDASEYLA